MTEITRLTDKVGIIGLDATDYPQESHETTVNTDLLQQSLELIETLGWEQVDVRTVEGNGDSDYPMLILRPPQKAVFDSTEQAGIAITPVTEKGRKE